MPDDYAGRRMRAVIFDLDGTLVDSEPLSDDAWRRVFAVHGANVSEADVRAAHGLRFSDAYARFARAALLPPPHIIWSDYSELLFASFDDRLVAFSDAVGTARRLHADGVALALVTSSQRDRLDRTIEAAALHELFTATVAGDEVSRGKPAPDGYLAAARLLGVDPNCCVAIEDSQVGIDAARAARMTVLAVSRSGSPAPLRGADLLSEEVSAAGVTALLSGGDPCGQRARSYDVSDEDIDEARASSGHDRVDLSSPDRNPDAPVNAGQLLAADPE
jgi:HAD superfamily hydrolase (TIGR01509 family)